MTKFVAIISMLFLLQETAASCYRCASSLGDPHINTFDQSKLQCQGTGDYILSKSLNSDFELQGRFWLPETLSQGRNGSSTVGAVLKTGVGSESTIEVAVTPAGFPAASEHDCDVRYWIDGEQKEFNSWDVTDLDGRFAFKRRTRHHVDHNGNNYTIPFRQFYMFDSRAILWMSKGWDYVFGCHLNLQLCVPCDFGETHDLVGLFGSPNGDKTDDFRTISGEQLPKPTLVAETNRKSFMASLPLSQMDSLLTFPFSKNTARRTIVSAKPRIRSSKNLILANNALLAPTVDLMT